MFKSWDACVQNFDNAKDVATIGCIPIVLLNITSSLLMFAGLAALAMFILGGFNLMNSAGDPKKLEGAKNNFKYGILGLMIVLFSFVVINTIYRVTGVKCVTDFGFMFGFVCEEQAPVNTPIIIPPRPTIQLTEAPSPMPRSRWTGQWNPNVTVPAQEWWDDMVAKGYISIDAIAQQSAGQEISDFLRRANLVPNPVKYYLEGYGFISNCNLKLDELVMQGLGHIRITSDAYAQIPGGVECQIFANRK